MTHDTQLPPVRVDEELKEGVQEFRQQNPSINNDSEAIRELLRRGLRQNRVAFGIMLMLASNENPEELGEVIADQTAVGTAVVQALNDVLTELTNSTDLDLVEMAGGEKELSKEELTAIYRLQRGEANLFHLISIGKILENMDQPEEFGKSVISHIDDLDQPSPDDLLDLE